MNMEEIITNLNENENRDLIWLRNYVDTKIKNIIEFENKIKEENKIKKENSLFKSKNEEYFFYLKLLIKDETNIDLLNHYLEFLKINEEYLNENNIPHETFNNELKYYSVFFEKANLIKYGIQYESQKIKFINILNDYYNSIKNNKLEDLKQREEKNKERRAFNQPLSYNSKELLYYKCYISVYIDILEQENNDLKNLEKKSYFLGEIIKRKIFEKFDEAEILLPLIFFLIFSEPKENCKFFLNYICSNYLKDEELEEKSKSLNYQFINTNINKCLIANRTCYFNPNELCLENLDSDYEICEKYNYKYLMKNPPLEININKIKEFIKMTLKSRVFKEAYNFLTGRNNYEKIISEDIISEFVDNIKFLPIKFSSAVAVIDRLSLTVFIPTMKKTIYSNKFNYNSDKNVTITLENGITIAFIYHEFGHGINLIISFKENKLKSLDSPRKKFLKFKEGGYYMELALFGRVIKNLSYGEALYILNLDNYNKSLEDFRDGFLKLNKKDLIIKEPFKDFNLENESKMNELKDTTFIKAKNNKDSIDNLKDIKSNVPLRNDVYWRKFDIKDLEPYL